MNKLNISVPRGICIGTCTSEFEEQVKEFLMQFFLDETQRNICLNLADKKRKDNAFLSIFKPAKNCAEQNIEIDVVERSEDNGVLANTGERLYTFSTMKEVPEGALLNAWFSQRSSLLLGIPILTRTQIIDSDNYQCHLCQTSYTQPNVLKAHLYLQICSGLANQLELLTELLNISMPKVWKESDDSNAPSEKSSTENSLETIESTRDDMGYLCKFCGKYYSRKYGLKIHIRTHTGYKPLQCKYCKKRFGDPSNLNKHVRLHSKNSWKSVKT